MTGRPTKFNTAVAEAICERLASGESLTQICQSKGMVGYSTVCRWLDKREDFREMCAHARECQAEFYAIKIIDISDELPITEMLPRMRRVPRSISICLYLRMLIDDLNIDYIRVILGLKYTTNLVVYFCRIRGSFEQLEGQRLMFDRAFREMG